MMKMTLGELIAKEAHKLPNPIIEIKNGKHGGLLSTGSHIAEYYLATNECSDKFNSTDYVVTKKKVNYFDHGKVDGLSIAVYEQ